MECREKASAKAYEMCTIVLHGVSDDGMELKCQIPNYRVSAYLWRGSGAVFRFNRSDMLCADRVGYTW